MRWLTKTKASTEPDPLDSVRAVWEAQARDDPLWAVLSDTDKRGRRWSVAEFLATGESAVEGWLARFAEFGGRLPDHDLALDFGCGVGRLSQPLARRFERVVGVDIAPTMIKIADRLNQQGDRVRYVRNDAPDLTFLPDDSITFVLSHITLQHVPPVATKRYLSEFFRVLKPGGGLIFQLPSHYVEGFLPEDRKASSSAEDDRRAHVRTQAPPTMTGGEPVILNVMVRNLSERDWFQSTDHPLNIGNHWVNAETGLEVIHDDGRARLPNRVAPGEEVEVRLVVTPPPSGGRFRLRIDLVEEGVSWWAENGNIESDDLVSVDPAPAHKGYKDSTFDDLLDASGRTAPAFDMYAIHIDELREFISGHGATLLAADEWVTEWHSFMYFVQAAGS